MAYHTNIEKQTIRNSYYRKVLYNTSNMQLVVMMLKPNEEIGLEKHKTIDQFVRVESGVGKVIITNSKKEIVQTIRISDGSAVLIPKNTYHNVINTGTDKLKLYTIYSPPNHPPHTKQKSKPADD
jgi:mannose-6-phosphate isomerase-like protein (cupin superfamily)